MPYEKKGPLLRGLNTSVPTNYLEGKGERRGTPVAGPLREEEGEGEEEEGEENEDEHEDDDEDEDEEK